ncbi:MAG: ribonuclease D [Maricaulaceae bacterium]
MNIITTTESLIQFCDAARDKDFLCVDTEFMRESTFYSELCLIQVATDTDEAIIDPLADGLDLAPFNALLMHESLTKVMHAARQDMEIFYSLCKAVPAPIFDTQIGAMALGLGDSVGYMALVKDRLGLILDKGARFTDWSRRPLSEKQLSYALADVTHLRDLYPAMIEELKERGRLGWIEEELKPQLNEELYNFDPDMAWQRLKVRNPRKENMAVLKAAASWREKQAIRRNIPRRRVVKDDALYDIAQNKPLDTKALARLRGVPKGFANSRSVDDLIKMINYALDNVDDYAPIVPKAKHMPPQLGPTIEMLRTLLKLCTEYEELAPRLVANASDIEQIAAFGEKADVAALTGWRREIFGNQALDLLAGKIALRLEGRKVVTQKLD